MAFRMVVLGLLAGAAGCFEPKQLTATAAYNQTIEGGSPVTPEVGPAYQTGGLAYKALCVYANDSYAHVTHYWSYNTALVRDDVIVRGTFARTGVDSLFFAGKYLNMRGRMNPDTVDIESGTHRFVRSAEIECPVLRP